MIKNDLINVVAEDTMFTKKEVTLILNSILSYIGQALVKNEEVRIAGFGTFTVRTRAERKGRNPISGEIITIPAAKYPKISFSKTIKDAVKAS